MCSFKRPCTRLLCRFGQTQLFVSKNNLMACLHWRTNLIFHLLHLPEVVSWLVCGQGLLGGNAAILVYCFKCSRCVSLSLGGRSIQIQPQVTAKLLHIQEDKVVFFPYPWNCHIFSSYLLSGVQEFVCGGWRFFKVVYFFHRWYFKSKL